MDMYGRSSSIHAMLVRERVGGAVAAESGRGVPDCDAVQTILARLPKPMHGSCERMDGRLQRDTRVYYWQQTGAPAPNGPGARTSRDRTVRLQRHVNANMDKLQWLMRMTDPQARHGQVSSADKEENGEVDHAVLDEMLNFSDLLCAPRITVPLRHGLIGYDTNELAEYVGASCRGASRSAR